MASRTPDSDAYNEDEMAEIRVFEAAAEEEYSRDFVSSRSFGFHAFISRSKGRNRQRNQPATVELYTFGTGAGRWYSNPPFDVWAGEAYNLNYDEPEPQGLSDRLRSDIRRGVI